MELYRSKILGTGVYHPQKLVTNDDLAQILDTSDSWIYERTGIRERRISSSEGGEFPTDMAYHASKQALETAQIDPNTIDLILFATLTPDYPLPNCASQLQVQLGLNNQCGCLDIYAACSGFVYGLNMADALIRVGRARNILVIGSEMLSKIVDWSDRTLCILLGDGCGAAVVGRASLDDSSAILAAELGADGRGRDFFYQEYGGVAKPFTEDVLRGPDRFMKMKGKEMFKVAVRTLADISLKTIQNAGVTIQDIDWVVPHQANIRIIETMASRLEVPMDKVIVNIDKYANTSAATVPMALHDGISDGRIKRGDLVLLAAFGAGLTSGATVLRY